MLKTLIVDDETLTRDILRNYIPWNNYGITDLKEADDGMSALELVRGWKPDIVLTDIKMPRLNGIELSTRLRESCPDCKIIFLTAYSDKEYIKSAIKLKAVSYIEKPINLDEIAEVLKSTILEFKKEKETKEAGIRYLMNELSLKLASGGMDPESVKPDIRNMNLYFPKDGRYVTTIVRFVLRNMENEKETPIYLRQITGSLVTMLRNRSRDFVYGFKSNDCIVLHFALLSDFEIPQLITLLDHSIKEVKKQHREVSRMLVGMGQCVTGLNNIYLSHQASAAALEKQFYTSYDTVVRYYENSTCIYKFDENLLAHIADYLKQDKKDEAISLIKKLSADIKNHRNTPPDTVKNYFFKIILIIAKAAEDRNIPFLKDECKFILDSVTTSYTLDEIETNITKLILSVTASMQARMNGENPVTKVSRYIRDNYGNISLSLGTLSENLYFTPSYICTLFKKETGKTINQYINEVRIEKAKDLLKEEAIKFYEIARRVGYNDGKYFSKVFNKMVGMKPKKFRELHHNAKACN